MLKIYIASSWKNEKDVKRIAGLLKQQGFEVDNFTDASTGRYVFHYEELGDLKQLDAMTFLRSEKAMKAFHEDRKWIDWSDGVLLILPAGKSAHLEAGYAAGKGKFLIIYQNHFPKGEFDVMYGFADLITDDFTAVIEFLNERRSDKVQKSSLCNGEELLKAIQNGHEGGSVSILADLVGSRLGQGVTVEELLEEEEQPSSTA